MLCPHPEFLIPSVKTMPKCDCVQSPFHYGEFFCHQCILLPQIRNVYRNRMPLLIFHCSDSHCRKEINSQFCFSNPVFIRLALLPVSLFVHVTFCCMFCNKYHLFMYLNTKCRAHNEDMNIMADITSFARPL